MPRKKPIPELYEAALAPVVRVLGRVHPNLITAVAAVVGILAGVAYGLTGIDARFFFLAAALVALSGVGDSLDGLVARGSGRSSRLGDFLDHFLDRVVEIAILAGLALSSGATSTLGLLVALVVVLNGYLGTQIEASFGHRSYSGLGKAELFVGLVIGSVLLGLVPGAAVPLGGRQVSLVDLFFAATGLLTLQAMGHRLRLAARLAREAERRR